MKKTLLTFLLLLCAKTIFAQFTIEQALNSPFPTELKASPINNQVAWVFNQAGSRNIFVADAPDFKAKKITPYEGDNGQEINSLSFLPNGKSIIFIRGGANNSAGEIPNPAELQGNVERAIYMVDTDGKNLRKLVANASYPKISPKGDVLAYLAGGQIWLINIDSVGAVGKKLFQSRGTQNSIRWSPDGSKIAFVSSRGDHSFIGICEVATKAIKYYDTSVDKDIDPVWSPDGKSLAFFRVPFSKDALIFGPERESSPWSIRVIDVQTAQAREIWKAKHGRGSAFFENSLVAENRLFWTADNAIVFPYEGDGWIHLYSISPNGGEAKLLTPNDGEVEYAVLANDKKTIIYNSNIGDIDRRHIWQVTGSGSPRQLSTGQGIEWSPAQTASGQIVVLHSDAQTPARPSLLSIDGKLKDFTLEFIPAEFPGTQLVTPQAVMLTATDGMKIPAQLFLPKNHKSGEKHPAAIFFHGGSRRQMLLGFNYGEYYHKAYALNQYLVSKGYVVLSVNYRSGIGYGMEFREALNYGATGATEYNDVMGAGLYLKNREDVDGSKIGLWGGSYGGYLTAMGLAKASDLFAVGVDIHGVHDWNVVVKNFIPAYDATKRVEWAKVAYQSSPMPYVGTWKSPVLLIHGDDDRNVPFSETVTIAEALRKNNVYFEQLIFPDEVHSFLLHQNWLNAYKATATFFDKFLKR